MAKLPLILNIAKENPAIHDPSVVDGSTIDDPLPVVLERNAAGYQLSRATRFTEVLQETTDDK